MPRRRARGEGAVYFDRSRGRWTGQLSIWDGGRRRRLTVHGRTRAEAARKLAELRAKLATGYPLLAERLTLEEFVGRWLEMVRPNLRPASWRCYSRNLALHVLPHLGRVRLQDLSPVHLRLLLAKWEKLGTGAVVRAKTWRTLHKVLQDALRMELVARNPADAVPGPKEKRPEIRCPSEEELRRLVEAARGTRYEALIILVCSTGMRLGEALGLRWQDLDLREGVAHVRVQLSEANHRPELQDVKTQSSRREVPLTPEAVAALRRWREKCLQEGSYHNPLGLVFVGEGGTPLWKSDFLRRVFHPLLRRAGLPRYTFHSLRHAVATTLLKANVHPKTVAALLGHSRVSVTLDTYSHFIPSLAREAVEVLRQRLRLG